MDNTADSSQKQQKGNQNIRVYVRVRPTNARERLIKSNEVLEVPGHREVIVKQTADSRSTKKFTFDRAFGMDSRQHEVYKTVVAPLIDEVLAGYNCTVFAYGQTGTGKTFTMVGEEQPNLSGSWEDPSGIGIIPRALCHLFDDLRLMDVEFAMRVSYLELYNEELCDLLSTDDTVKIRIFDDSTKKGSVIVQGLEEIPVKSKDDVYKLLAKGQDRRKTAATLMNAQSSRSHTVFSILVHIKENNVDGEEMLKIGKLNLVDLAGSENISKAGNEKGIRTRETVNINQSLLTLGRVITALVEKTPHVPYRESKLTRLLQESLGGRTKTSIIATVSPGHKDLDETMSTLDYAHRAKNIQNKPEINQRMTKKAILKEYTEEIDKLKRDLMAARDKNGIYLAEDTYNDMVYKMESQAKELNDKVLYLKAIKDELASKTKMFEETQYHLEVVSENLAKTQDRFRITEADLVRTKKNLKHSKKKVEEKKFLLTQHMKTESLLTNQAKELIQVADTAASDTKGLHESIDRRKTVEEKIRAACEGFTTYLIDNIHHMKLDISQLTKNHQDNSNIIVQDIKENYAHLKKYAKELEKLSENIRVTNETTRQGILQQVTNWRNQLRTKITHDMDTTFAGFKEIVENSNKSFEAWNDKIVEIINGIHEDGKQSEESFKHTVARVERLNHSVENSCKFVAGNLTEFEKKLREVDKKGCVEIQEQLEKKKLLSEKQDQKMQTIEKLLQELKELQVEEKQTCQLIGEKNEKLLADKTSVYADLAKNHKSLNECREEISSDCMETLRNIHQMQETDKSARAKKTESLNSVKNNTEEFKRHLFDLVHRNENNCNMQRDYFNENMNQITRTVQAANDKDNKDLEAKHESLQKVVLDEKDRLETINTNIETYVKEILNKVVHEAECKLMETLGKCSDEIGMFKDEQLVKYEPTGATPARKDYQFTRNLAATSPHDRLIRKMRLDCSNPVDLDASITILEDDESVTPSDLNSTSIEIRNSTPLKSSENSDKNRRALQTLEISKVMKDLNNKENLTGNSPSVS